LIENEKMEWLDKNIDKKTGKLIYVPPPSSSTKTTSTSSSSGVAGLPHHIRKRRE